jgi:hypothetical protein
MVRRSECLVFFAVDVNIYYFKIHIAERARNRPLLRTKINELKSRTEATNILKV